MAGSIKNNNIIHPPNPPSFQEARAKMLEDGQLSPNEINDLARHPQAAQATGLEKTSERIALLAKDEFSVDGKGQTREEMAFWGEARKEEAYASAQADAQAHNSVLRTFLYNYQYNDLPGDRYEYHDEWNYTFEKPIEVVQEDFAAWKAERRDAAYAQAQKEAAAKGGVVDTFNYNADMIEQPDGTFKFKDNWNFTWKKA